MVLSKYKLSRIDFHRNKQSVVTLEGVVALLLLLILSLAAVVYHLIRIQYNGAIDFSLDWNLFLSWIPLLIAYITRIHSRARPKQYPVTILLSIGWLLFFPNAPYMVTDLIHLSVDYDRNLTWHDAIMLFYYAQVSLINGLISLYWMHQAWLRVFGGKAGVMLLLLSFPLAGYGIYLGRIKRVNSWNILTDPIGLFRVVIEDVTEKTAILFAFEFALLLGMLYLVLWILLRYRLRKV